jgi:hypothetical protein
MPPIEMKSLVREIVERSTVAQRAQRIGDILKRGYHRSPILRVSLLESGFGGLLPMIQSETIESGLRDVVGQRVKESRGAKQIRQLSWTRTEVRRPTDDRQPIGPGDAGQSGRAMQIGRSRLYKRQRIFLGRLIRTA